MKPPWVDAMRPRAWYRISGDEPQLGLAPTPAGTRYLADNDGVRPAAEPGPHAR